MTISLRTSTSHNPISSTANKNHPSGTHPPIQPGTQQICEQPSKNTSGVHNSHLSVTRPSHRVSNSTTRSCPHVPLVSVGTATQRHKALARTRNTTHGASELVPRMCETNDRSGRKKTVPTPRANEVVSVTLCAYRLRSYFPNHAGPCSTMAML